MTIALSIDADGLRPDDDVSCAAALVETFVAELRAGLAPDRVTFEVDYASLAHTPHPLSGKSLQERVVALAQALLARISERSAASVHLAFRGVRTSGTVRLEVRIEGTALAPEGLAEEIDAEGAALLEEQPHRAVFAFYPQIFDAGESISANR